MVRAAGRQDDEIVIGMLLRLRTYAVGDGFLAEAATLYGELLRRSERTRDLAVQAAALRLLGGVETYSKGLAAARRRLEAALPLSRRVGDEEGESTCLNNVGEVIRLGGDLVEAERWFRSALELAERRHDVARMTLQLANIGLCRLGAGDLAGAEAHALRALEGAGDEGADRGRSVALRVLADARLRQGRLDEAADDARAALEVSNRTSYLEGVARLRILLVRLRFAEGKQESACAAMRDLAAELGAEGLPWEQGEALFALGAMLRETGADPRPAEREAAGLHRRLMTGC